MINMFFNSQGFLGKFNVKHMDLGDVLVQSSHQSIVEGESESSDDESEAEMKFIRKTVKSRGNYYSTNCYLVNV